MKIDPKTLTKDDVGRTLWTDSDFLFWDDSDSSPQCCGNPWRVIFHKQSKQLFLLDLIGNYDDREGRAVSLEYRACLASAIGNKFYTEERDAIEAHVKSMDESENVFIRRIEAAKQWLKDHPTGSCFNRQTLTEEEITALDKETPEA